MSFDTRGKIFGIIRVGGGQQAERTLVARTEETWLDAFIMSLNTGAGARL